VRGDGDNGISLLLPNGSRIVGLPGTEATVRGFSAVSDADRRGGAGDLRHLVRFEAPVSHALRG
jgi:hypothetical protein